MPTTFQVIGNVADFSNGFLAGINFRVETQPEVKTGDVSIHSNPNKPVAVSDDDGNFTFLLITKVGLWYRVYTDFGEINPVNLAGYIPDVDDPTTGVVFPPGTVISLRTVMDEDPTPGYEGIAYAGGGGLAGVGVSTIWSGSQAAYDAITTPDPDALYFVTG